MSFTDTVQAISAAIVAVLTVFLWNLARRQTDLLASSVEIARRSAEAARKSAEVAERALVGVQRPMLQISIGGLTIEPATKVVPFLNFIATVRVRNVGKEAAIIVDCAAEFHPRQSPYTAPTPGQDAQHSVWSIVNLDPRTIILPNEEVSFSIDYLMDTDKGETLDAFNGLDAALYVFGVIVYDDPIGIRRELGFTSAWTTFENPEGEFASCNFEGRNYDRIIASDSKPILRTDLDIN